MGSLKFLPGPACGGQGGGDWNFHLGFGDLLYLPSLFLSPDPTSSNKALLHLRIFMAEDIFYWLALSLTPGLGSVLIKRLLDRFKTPEAVFSAPLKELLRIEGLGEKVAAEIQKGPLEKV